MMGNILDKFVEKIRKRILYSINFFEKKATFMSLTCMNPCIVIQL